MTPLIFLNAQWPQAMMIILRLLSDSSTGNKQCNCRNWDLFAYILQFSVYFIFPPCKILLHHTQSSFQLVRKIIQLIIHRRRLVNHQRLLNTSRTGARPESPASQLVHAGSVPKLWVDIGDKQLLAFFDRPLSDYSDSRECGTLIKVANRDVGVA